MDTGFVIYSDYFSDANVNKWDKTILEHLKVVFVGDMCVWEGQFRSIRSQQCGSQAECQRCGSRKAQDFRRNGHRKRQLVTEVGVIDFWLLRVVCQCGGSVYLHFPF